MSRVPTIAHDLVVNDGSTGHLFNQDPHFGQFSQQGGLIPNQKAYQGVYNDYQTNAFFEYDQFARRHAPATEHDQLHQSLPSNSFMGVDARMHSAASSSLLGWSGLGCLALAPPPASTSTLSSSSLPGHARGKRPASSQYPSHAQMLSPLQAMVSNGPGCSEPDPIKLSDKQMEAIKTLLIQYGWYVAPDEEPPIKPDDPFITQGLILRTDKTRFSALVFSAPTGGKTFCRIRHSSLTKNELAECTFSAVHPKDAIAHVCDYLNYKPYKCKGKGGHAECDSRYSTRERRNDHYAKKKSGPGTHESCERCGASITTRNFPRHREKCTNIKNYAASDASIEAGNGQSSSASLRFHPYAASGASIEARHGQSSLASLSSPEPVGLRSTPSQNGHLKLSLQEYASRSELLRNELWFQKQTEEPLVTTTDEFVKRYYISTADKTRFSAFVGITPGHGRTVCRIPHEIIVNGDSMPCTYEKAHLKEAIAHVSIYFGYKGYRCQITEPGHSCDKGFPTRERRNDHQSKANKRPDARIDCALCNKSVLERNMERHKMRCKGEAETESQPEKYG